MLDQLKLEEIYNDVNNIDYKRFTLSNGEEISTKINAPLFKYIHDNLIKYSKAQTFGYFREKNILKDDLIDLGDCQELLDITIDYGIVIEEYFNDRFNIENEIKELIRERAHSKKWRHNTIDLDIGISLTRTGYQYSLYIRYKDFAMVAQEVVDSIIDGKRTSIIKD
jgi:hypothetical protein